MGMPTTRSLSLILTLTLTLTRMSPRRRLCCPSLHKTSLKSQLPATPQGGNQRASSQFVNPTAKALPIVDEAVMGFLTGKRKATELAHSVWKNIIQKGDTVVDATCGNGYDTLVLLKLIADESGRVYGMDIQRSALENTNSLLEKSVEENERKLVKLSLLCHSKMEDIVPKDSTVRLVAFNLGYLPGGDKSIITASQTTLKALQSASRILMSGGLISLVVYVGHSGGRDELEVVQSFASSLPAETWVSSKFELPNRPTAPILVLLFKK